MKRDCCETAVSQLTRAAAREQQANRIARCYVRIGHTAANFGIRWRANARKKRDARRETTRWNLRKEILANWNLARVDSTLNRRGDRGIRSCEETRARKYGASREKQRSGNFRGGRPSLALLLFEKHSTRRYCPCAVPRKCLARFECAFSIETTGHRITGRYSPDERARTISDDRDKLPRPFFHLQLVNLKQFAPPPPRSTGKSHRLWVNSDVVKISPRR